MKKGNEPKKPDKPGNQEKPEKPKKPNNPGSATMAKPVVAAQAAVKSKWREYAESLIIAALIAFVVRSFVVQAFKIPSASMEPTLLVGDHLLVNRLSYVMKIPFTDKVIFNLGDPERGDVVVFRYPIDRNKDFIKRLIAKGGDKVEIKSKTIYING